MSSPSAIWSSNSPPPASQTPLKHSFLVAIAPHHLKGEGSLAQLAHPHFDRDHLIPRERAHILHRKSPHRRHDAHLQQAPNGRLAQQIGHKVVGRLDHKIGHPRRKNNPGGIAIAKENGPPNSKRHGQPLPPSPTTPLGNNPPPVTTPARCAKSRSSSWSPWSPPPPPTGTVPPHPQEPSQNQDPRQDPRQDSRPVPPP